MTTKSIHVNKGLGRGMCILICAAVAASAIFFVLTAMVPKQADAAGGTLDKPTYILNLYVGLVGWWTFDGPDTIGTTTAEDDSPGGHNGSTVGFGGVIATSSIWANTGSGTWTAPSGIKLAYIELWAGGGGGGAASSSRGAGGGGGGGGYTGSYFSVNGGTGYSFYVGRAGGAGANGVARAGNGEDSMFNSSTTLIAKGGQGGGGGGNGAAGNGGAVGIGANSFSGGTGAVGVSGSNHNSGAGGGGAGTSGAGGNANGSTAGQGTAVGGGNGGAGQTAVGTAGAGGSVYGGAGGGGYAGTSGSVAGGAGAQGRMRVTGYQTLNFAQWMQGIMGQAAFLDGIGSYISLGSVNAGVQTLSFWFKASTSTTQSIIDLNGTQTVSISSNTVNANSWSGATRYVDGVAGSTVSDKNWHLITITNSSGINASAMNIGRVGSGYCGCTLDDVRVYSRALSPSEVAQLYTQGTATRRSVSVAGPLNLSGPSSGLVGWWTMDGSNMLKSIADTSGSNFNGNLVGSTATTTVPGEAGSAFNFMGTSTYVNVPSSSNSVQTVSFWEKVATSTLDWFLTLNSTVNITASSTGTVNANGFASPTIYVDGSAGSSINNMWHLITITTATPVNASAMTIGKAIGSVCGCYIDDVRIYSRALSATEVKQLYAYYTSTTMDTSVSAPSNLGPGASSGLIAWYPLDGPTIIQNVADMSGFGHNLIFGTGVTATSSMQAIGKLGQALNFSGVNNTAASTTSGVALNGLTRLTLTAWMRRNVANALVAVGQDDGANMRTSLSYFSDGLAYCIAGGNGTTDKSHSAATVGNDLQWHFFVCTFDASQTTGNRSVTYVDGVVSSAGDTGANVTSLAGPASFYIGYSRTDTTFSNGDVDDVRIYNRVLSQSEINYLYNLGL